MGFSLICLIKEKTYYKTKSFPVLRMYQACTLAKDRWLTDVPESTQGDSDNSQGQVCDIRTMKHTQKGRHLPLSHTADISDCPWLSLLASFEFILPHPP